MRLGVTTTDLHALARMIRRRESGACTEKQLTGAFDDVLNALQALMVEWRPHLSSLRHRPSAEMRDCDDAISAAQRASRGGQFRECLLQFKRVRGVLARLQALSDAYEEHGHAVEAYGGLKTLLDSQQLCRLLTVETVARLLEESDKLLESGRSRQAGFIARLCRNKAVALTEEDGVAGGSVRELSARIERQAEFFRQTEAFAPSPDDVKLRRAFERLPDLLSEGRITLVARLVTDIECELASRRAVLGSLRRSSVPTREPDGAARMLTDELKRIVREESWEQAANHLLRQTLTALSSEATALRPVIGHVGRQMDAARGDDPRPRTDAAVN